MYNDNMRHDDTIIQSGLAKFSNLSLIPFRKIIFFELSSHDNVVFEPDWCDKNPIGGSETATIYMASTLRKLGYDVEIITSLEKLHNNQCDIFIAGRTWNAYEAGILPGRLNYLWCQDDANVYASGALKKELRQRQTVFNLCDSLFFLSHYQQQQWIHLLNVPVNKTFITSNGIPLDKFFATPSSLSHRPRWLYYSSTPQRGLHILVKVWPLIHELVKDAKLHIFSSLKVYNTEDTDEFKQIFKQAMQLPGVAYYGSVGQQELRNISQQCRVLAYPCIFPETSCITAMEAMASGCAVVGTTLGALPETAWKNPLVPLCENWIEKWLYEVINVLMDDSYYESYARQNLNNIWIYDWSAVAIRWLEKFILDWRTKA